jgi:exopolysaccharide biosynthesis polyprenyl glycosylphosphotransferase
MPRNSAHRSRFNEAVGSPRAAGPAHEPVARRRRLLGYVRVADGGRAGADEFRWFSSSTELESIVRWARVMNVYITAGEGDQREARQSALEVCNRFGLPVAPHIPNGTYRPAPADEALADGYRAFVPHSPTVSVPWAKRALDLLLSVVALLVLLPLLAVIALAIKLTDGGPVFFGQPRVGLRGRTFTMLKFRSMVVNADGLKRTLAHRNESNGPVFKMLRDPRITGVGRILRKYSLDELPQLINVVRGEMSIVGPRPPVPNEVAQYEPWQFRRLAAVPGLTCLWQVEPNRYRMSFDDWVRLDLQYIDHRSMWLDVRLILRTFWVVLAGTGE